MKYQFPTYRYLPEVTDPVILIHGTDDWVIPYSQSERLQPLLKKTDRLIPVEGGGHNDLFEYSRVPQVLDSLLN
jgi:pimeloyl-ACP methyl ester carboxylesterase